MKQMIVIGLTGILLAGCVEYRWDRPGASQHELDVDLAECKAKGLRTLPPKNMISNAHKDVHPAKDKHQKITDYRLDIIDVNEENREVIIQDCMYSKGWTMKEIKSGF